MNASSCLTSMETKTQGTTSLPVPCTMEATLPAVPASHLSLEIGFAFWRTRREWHHLLCDLHHLSPRIRWSRLCAQPVPCSCPVAFCGQDAQLRRVHLPGDASDESCPWQCPWSPMHRTPFVFRWVLRPAVLHGCVWVGSVSSGAYVRHSPASNTRLITAMTFFTPTPGTVTPGPLISGCLQASAYEKCPHFVV